MRKLIALLGLCLLTLPAVCQSSSRYEVATILEVKPHQEAGTRDSGAASYDVSVKVGDTIYVALYTQRLGESDAKHATGRDLLVQVGTTTITYHDIMGRSYEVPILSRKAAPLAKERSR